MLAPGSGGQPEIDVSVLVRFGVRRDRLVTPMASCASSQGRTFLPGWSQRCPGLGVYSMGAMAGLLLHAPAICVTSVILRDASWEVDTV